MLFYCWLTTAVRFRLLFQNMVTTLSRRELSNILQKSHNDSTLQVISFDICAACGEGENYMSQVDRVNMRVKKEGGASSSLAPGSRDFSASVVVKSLPNNPQLREILHSARAFANEAAAYDHVVPALNAVGQDSLPFARLLFSRVRDREDDMLVLEDLAPAGFRLGERRLGLDTAHRSLVARQLALLHARSLAAKWQCPSALRAASKQLTEVVFFPGALHSFGLSIDNALQMAADSIRITACGDSNLQKLAVALDSLRMRPHKNGRKAESENVSDGLHHIVSDIQEAANQRQEHEEVNNNGEEELQQGGGAAAAGRGVFLQVCELLRPREPYAVVQHGDCWLNNLFFSYHQDGSVDQVRFLDLQIVRYSSPLVDILHFVYTSSAGQDLQADMRHFTAQYHVALRAALRGLGVDPDLQINGHTTCPSLEWLHEEARRMGLYGLAMGLLLLPAVTLATEHVPDLESTLLKDDFYSQQTVASMAAKLPPDYARRATQLVQECARQGVLQHGELWDVK